MQIKRYILLTLSCLLMQSCASQIDEQRIQAGKVSFMSGDFKSAFHQLLPLAAEGIPQAEYGVGYMYYYGYGVTQDTESGIFWMNKAAAAHYAPAIRALAAISENNIKDAQQRKYTHESATPKINQIHAENDKIEPEIAKNAIREAFNKTPAERQGHVTVMPLEDQTTVASSKSQQPEKVSNITTPTVENANPQKYTLQILGSYYLSSLKARQAQLNLGVPTHIGQTKYNGRDWYVLTIGQYPALGNAELAKLDLPKKVKDYKPWIRKCDELTWVG